MSKIKTSINLLKSDRHLFLNVLICKFAKTRLSHWFSDKFFIKLRYWGVFGKTIDLKHPRTFNEKLNWMKLYDRCDKYTRMVDKFEVKNYVAQIIGEKYVIPNIAIYGDVGEINIDELPDKFVLKCTHDSGSVIVCKDKKRLDFNKAKKILKRGLSHNLFWWGREWPYKNVKPRILAEVYMEDVGNDNLPVYKFFCFNGEPQLIQTIQNDKHPEETIDYFSPEWNLLELRQDYPNSTHPFPKPIKLLEMLEIARKLSKGFPFLRVDLYQINGEVKFSEFTFYSDCGLAYFTPECWDSKLGEMIKLNY